jgi:class 3 adenylate cyclase
MDPRDASASQVQVEAFGRRHRTGLVTLVFTDMVGSTALKQQLGDHAGAQLIEQHHALVRATVRCLSTIGPRLTSNLRLEFGMAWR